MRVAPRDRGFSLVEVLVASVILAIALIALSSLFMVGLKTNAVAKEETIMAALAQDKLEFLRHVPSTRLVDFLPADCQGTCNNCVCGVGCTAPCCPTPCYASGCNFPAGPIEDLTEKKVPDPNYGDALDENSYIRTWRVERVDMEGPVGCVFKISVTVGSRKGLFAAKPPSGDVWGNADWEDVVGAENPRRVVVSTYRR